MSEEQFDSAIKKGKTNAEAVVTALAKEYLETADNNPDRKKEIRDEAGFAAETAYFDSFPMPETKTDADGKFAIPILGTEMKIIACRSQRELLDNSERYFWITDFFPKGKTETIMFANDNLFHIGAASGYLPEGTSFYDELKRLEKERAAQFEEERRKAAEKSIEEQQRLEEKKRLQIRVYQKAAEKKRNETLRRAVEYNLSLANKGDAYGQFRMGERFRDGDGVEKDEAKAREYFAKAAAQGHADAAKALGKLKTQRIPRDERF